MEQIKKSAEDLRILADEEGLYELVAMLEDHLTNYNKNICFLKTMSK